MTCFVVLAGVILLHFAVTNPNGDVTGGWTMNVMHMRVGLTRAIFPFLAGLLLLRIAPPTYIKKAFMV